MVCFSLVLHVFNVHLVCQTSALLYPSFFFPCVPFMSYSLLFLACNVNMYQNIVSVPQSCLGLKKRLQYFVKKKKTHYFVIKKNSLKRFKRLFCPMLSPVIMGSLFLFVLTAVCSGAAGSLLDSVGSYPVSRVI